MRLTGCILSRAEAQAHGESTRDWPRWANYIVVVGDAGAFAHGSADLVTALRGLPTPDAWTYLGDAAARAVLETAPGAGRA